MVEISRWWIAPHNSDDVFILLEVSAILKPFEHTLQFSPGVDFAPNMYDEFEVRLYLQNSDSFLHNYAPESHIGSTTYSKSFEWSLGASANIGSNDKGPNGGVSVSGGIKHSNTETRCEPDVKVVTD